MYVIDGNSVSLFLDLESKHPDFVSSPGLGTGFGSITFHPEFATNGKFYTGHSEDANSAPADLAGSEGLPSVQQGVVTEWTMVDTSSNDASSAASREVLRIDYSDTVHALQEIAFNPIAESGDEDYGLLYILTGDSGSVNDDTPANVGHIESPMGSILRIDPAGNNSANGEYGIPVTNPWADEPGPDTVKELYAIGFRNPHRIAWDSVTGKVLVGNIGERQLEEVELIVPGGNYGWPHREGTFLFDINDRDNVYPLPASDNPEFLYPVAQYDHDEGFAIIGGVVYRGDDVPELYGKYIFGDIRDGRVFYCDVDDLVLGSQATIYELTLTRNGSPTTLQALAGNSRADLRFGYDNDGELYILTKTDGKIRRVVSGEVDPVDPVTPVVNDPTAWAQTLDFESDDLSALFVTQTNAANTTPAAIVEDPYDNPGNHILALQAGVVSNNVFASVPIPEIANDATGTVYIRFAVPTFDKDVVFGVSDVSNPDAYGDYEAALRSAIDDGLDVRDGGSYDEVIPAISLDTWYETWLVIDNVKDTYAFYIKGGDYDAATLIDTGINFRNGTSSGISTYLWGLTSGTPGNEKGTGVMYFDDLYVDNDVINLSSPIQDRWYLLDDFEDTLGGWTFVDTDNQTDPFIPDPQVVELIEDGENSYLMRAAAPDGVAGNRKAIAYKSLPFSVPVSGVVTLYMRFNTEAFPNNHVFGLSNMVGNDIEANHYESIEAIIQVTDRYENDGILRVRSGGDYFNITNPNTGLTANPLEEDTWYEIWLVVNNGGRASGGQTYDVYLRGGEEFPEQTKVFDHAFFRVNRETSLLNFVSISNSGPNDADFYGTGALSFDDIFLHNGEVLTSPLPDVILPVEPTLTFAPMLMVHRVIRPYLDFDTLANRSYQVQSSVDLKTWDDFGSPITGTGSARLVGLTEQIHQGRMFFRLLLID